MLKLNWFKQFYNKSRVKLQIYFHLSYDKIMLNSWDLLKILNNIINTEKADWHKVVFYKLVNNNNV